MPYRFLALDLDDTLLGEQESISPRNREAIRAAQARGVVVTLATGRMYASARVFAEELGVVVPLITYNGALIKDNAGRVYLDRPLPLPAARIALDVAREHNIHVNLFLEDVLYVDRDDEWTERYRRSNGVTPHFVPDLAAVLTRAPNKVLLVAKAEKLAALRPELAARLGPAAHITSSKPTFIEVIHPQVSKKSGLAYLLSSFGIPAAEAVAVGDNYNDLEMINLAGLGVAMGNAPAEVRAEADYVTAKNTEDGVAQVIERFLLS
ncbi:Cof-type HAD-IIB family hydrolase [Gelria sp. Kuro-4]|uniref:Cof-type HAD-IIB family hydrolase n=1 Tax=Gelria sp. Kuro-4 TaxID=2796927 RepID=UPI001BF087BF|nr:Cof-type HAD-IIB family hydrolase [Gelria sp. Kuro-4]MDK2928282.1 hypothetical protein [Bacillota bacterium]BCV25761.1 haloacid dehalogenase [Gelria sp. Kuro-4]